MMAPRYLIGVDVGTSNTKVGLFREDGCLVALASGSYPMQHEGSAGRAEQDPEDWWRVVCAGLRQVVAKVDARDIVSLCVVGQGPSSVLVDEDGRPLCPALTWMDGRCTDERDFLRARGLDVSPYAHLPQILWLQRHRPRAFARARWALAAWDYIALRLCGRAIASHFPELPHIRASELDTAGLPQKLAAPGLRMTQIIGEIGDEAARLTGLSRDTSVVAGENDGLAATLGVGLSQPGRAIDPGGTAGGFGLCWRRPLALPGMDNEASVIAGHTLVAASFSSLGKAFDWFADLVAHPEQGVHELRALAEESTPGAEALIFLPHLAGLRREGAEGHARAVFFGLSLQHGRAQLARAILESSAYATRQLIEACQGGGARVDEVRVCGAQAGNLALNRMKADIWGVPVAIPRVTESATLGAAIMAGVGAARFSDLATACDRMVHIQRRLTADRDRQAIYNQVYALYRRLQSDLSGAFDELHGLRRNLAATS